MAIAITPDGVAFTANQDDPGTTRLNTEAQIPFPRSIDFPGGLPYDVATSDTGRVAVSDFDRGVVAVINPGQTQVSFSLLLADDSGVTGVAWLPSGELAIAQTDLANILVYNVDTAATRTITLGGRQLQNPSYLAVDSDGTIYATGDDGIMRVNPGSSTVSAFIAVATGAPLNVAISPNDLLYISNPDRDTVSVIERGDTFVPTTMSLPGGSEPYGVAVGPDGTVYSANRGTGTVSRITPAATKPAAQTLRPTKVKKRKAKLRAEVDPNFAATKVKFKYGPKRSLKKRDGTKTSKVAGRSTGGVPVQVQKKIKRLQPRTKYFYRVIAKNRAGKSVGKIKKFRTRR